MNIATVSITSPANARLFLLFFCISPTIPNHTDRIGMTESDNTN